MELCIYLPPFTEVAAGNITRSFFSIIDQDAHPEVQMRQSVTLCLQCFNDAEEYERSQDYGDFPTAVNKPKRIAQQAAKYVQVVSELLIQGDLNLNIKPK